MTRPLLVLGAGGHAKVLIEALIQRGAEIVGILDINPALIGTTVLGVPIIGGDSRLNDFSPEEIVLVNGIGSVGRPIRRKEIFLAFREAGYNFAVVVHPSAIIASDVVIEAGAQIMAGAVIQTGTIIGSNSIINTRVSVDHDCLVGRDVHIAPGVTLSGGVKVGDSVHIGTGATVIQGISIGDDSFIAAGAVVTADILPGAKVRGIPARKFQ